MSALAPEFAAIAHLLPEEHVGTVIAIQPISMGLSGAAVYAVQSERRDASWRQQLLVLRGLLSHSCRIDYSRFDDCQIVAEPSIGLPVPRGPEPALAAGARR